MQISKPPHNRYALNCLDNETYVKYSNIYSVCKRWGVRGIYTFLGSTGLWGIAEEVTQGTVVQYGKRRLATVVIGGATYICAPAVAVIMNATRVAKSCKVVYLQRPRNLSLLSKLVKVVEEDVGGSLLLTKKGYFAC